MWGSGQKKKAKQVGNSSIVENTEYPDTVFILKDIEKLRTEILSTTITYCL